jgi:hypothetical protein
MVGEVSWLAAAFEVWRRLWLGEIVSLTLEEVGM